MKTLTCGLLFFAAISAFAQDVAPPPRPGTANSALAPTLESFKQALLSSGRVEHSYSVNGGTTKFWQRITSVVVDAPGCQARVHYDRSANGSDPTDNVTSVFFESIDTSQALGIQEAYDRARSRLGQPSQTTFSGDVYVLYINGTASFPIFPDKAHATQAADAANRAAQICRTMPVTPSTAAGAPGLAETLQFIADKMNDNGAVNYRSMYRNPDGSSSNHMSYSSRLTQATADPSSCIVHVNARTAHTVLTPAQGTFNSTQALLRSAQAGDNKEIPTSDNRDVLSFRRVEKLEVSNYQDATNRTVAAGATFTMDPVAYGLTITYLGGATNFYYLRDEDMANRIAKAMNHAVELCGGGSKDPF